MIDVKTKARQLDIDLRGKSLEEVIAVLHDHGYVATAMKTNMWEWFIKECMAKST